MSYSYRLSQGLPVLLLGGLVLPLCAERHALLVGINDYQNARRLKGAVNDIQAVRKLLVTDLKFRAENVRVLLDQQATKAGILNEMAELSRRARPGDTALIYYSGHGWLVDDIDSDESVFEAEHKFDEALVPFDAQPWPRERANDPNPTLITDDEISRVLGAMNGRRLIVIFDSCHSGSGLRALPNEEDVSRSLYAGIGPPASRFKSLQQPRANFDLGGQLVFLSAASWRQTASDLGDFEGRRHGAFTASLLRAAQAAGPDWPKTTSWEGLLRQVRGDLTARGIASQTPGIDARGGLGRVPIEQFFEPLPAQEIAELMGPKPFEVYLEANKFQFLEGELLELAIESQKSGYLYVFDINPEQKVTQLFPNRLEPENQIPAGQLMRIPSRTARYQLKAGRPFGSSTVVAIVTREPWSGLTKLNLPTGLQSISEYQTAGLRDGLRGLNAATRDIYVVAANQAAAAPAARQEVSVVEWSSQKAVVEVVARRAEEPIKPVSVRPPVAAAAAPAVLAAAVAETPAAPVVETPAAAPKPAAATPAPAQPAVSARSLSEDDSDLTWDEQQDLLATRPALFQKLERLAARYSPVFWQDVGGGPLGGQFRPWKDFFVRYDFDRTSQGPNWPEPFSFQDENKRVRNRALDGLLTPSPRRKVTPLADSPGVFQVQTDNSEPVTLDLRPVVYWTVLATSTHYFFHYAAFKAEDWKPIFGHTGDLEGCTIVVDRKTEKVVAALALAHDDVQVTRDLLTDEPEGNIEVLMDPSLATRDAFGDNKRPVNGALAMDATRAGDPSAKEHQDIYSEARGHGQYGAHKIRKSRYIVYANYLPGETWRAPSFDQNDYPVTDKFEEVSAKHKYELVFFGTGKRGTATPEQKTLWSEYRDLNRFSGGVNPPWCWRDNLYFRTGWWKDPRVIIPVGEGKYRLNPYLE